LKNSGAGRNLAVALIFAVILSGCGGQKPDNAAATASPASSDAASSGQAVSSAAEKVTIRFWQSGADTAGAAETMQGILSEFEADNPDIAVEYQAIPWADDPDTKIQTAIAGGDVADLLVTGNVLPILLADSGQVRALDDVFDDDVRSDFIDSILPDAVYHGKNAELNGKTVYYPLFTGARSVLYNKTLFDEAGVSYPEDDWTLDDFYSTAEKLTGKIGNVSVYGFGTSAYYASQYLPFVWDEGGSILNDAQTAAAVDSDAWRKAISDYKSVYDKGCTPKGSEAMKLADIQKLFIDGQVGMIIATSDYATEISESADFKGKLGVAMMPEGSAGQYAFGGADVLCIPAKAQHPEEAARLLNYLLGTKPQTEYAKTIGFDPSVVSAAEDPYFSSDPVTKVFKDNAAHSRLFIQTPYAAGVTDLLRSTIQQYIAGDLDLDQYIKTLNDGINALIEEQ
jgi:ABC-type glycerol-3-phosphate transport system substrate-binding protein